MRPVPDTHTGAGGSGLASPRILCDIRALGTRIPAAAGAVRKLAERGRQPGMRIRSPHHVPAPQPSGSAQ